MKLRLWQPRYFVVTTIAVALVVLGVRLESLAHSLIYGTEPATMAVATAEDEPAKLADKAPVNAPAPGGDKAKTPEGAPLETRPQEKVEAKSDRAAVPEADGAGAPEPPAHAYQAPLEDLSEGEMEVLKQLSSRRALLDKREQELTQKTAILHAAEMRVDRKVKDMEALRAQLQAMLSQRTEEQQAQIDNLVKIYEAMKPKEAARILQTLDMSVLLGVMRQMKPARSAPILAEMDAAKAKDITMTLAKQHDLPETKAAN